MGNVEEKHLKELCGKKVRVFMNNGYQEKGVLAEFDERVIVIKSEHTGCPYIIYKDNVSTVKPM